MKYMITIPSHNSCCNTCEDVRKAYRTKGWALKDPDGIEQVSYCIINYFKFVGWLCSIT